MWQGRGGVGNSVNLESMRTGNVSGQKLTVRLTVLCRQCPGRIQYDQIFAAVKAMPTEDSSKEIRLCMDRSRSERAGYVKSLMHDSE